MSAPLAKAQMETKANNQVGTFKGPARTTSSSGLDEAAFRPARPLTLPAKSECIASPLARRVVQRPFRKAGPHNGTP